MKTKLPKVLASALIATVLSMSCVSSAFAGDISSTMQDVGISSASSDIVATPNGAGEYDMGEVPRNGDLILYPVLYSYIGFQKTFFITTTNIYSDETPSGKIRVYIYKPNGDLLKYSTVGANEDNTFTFTLPPSGTYTVRIYSEVNEPILVSVGWEA